MNNLVQLPETIWGYFVCSFMTCLYVIGGWFKHGRSMTCLKYDTTTSKWTNIASMDYGRKYAACTIF